jgi:hypothetical protein
LLIIVNKLGLALCALALLIFINKLGLALRALVNTFLEVGLAL